ncbi:putative endonuclease exonuclease phosphatase family protein [Eutypa lata UCREL1]|uniref:Putative endonuclease exonuclease phosphatase family protein n=1 Tax=Eutypa lata (strain UCR-EL1) TaxID=1287681 RepID=M7SMX4_EUTLA|nr:putative endonuclease exonuclease phosphatase family protein [Eutypa lata UCREL1]
MKASAPLWRFAATLLAIGASAETIQEINGNRFISPLNGQNVTDVEGVVTAKGPSGIWIQSVNGTSDTGVSSGIYVYGSALAKNTSIAVGDVIVLDGRVSEYRSSSDYLYLTEIDSPTITAIQGGGGETIDPVVIGETVSPPTQQYSALDDGDVFAVPNNQSLVSAENPILDPESYGLDFWESLSGMLVTIKSPRTVGRVNQYGDTWVVGDWATTGDNERTGLTITSKDGNPETILVGEPLDGSENPQSKLGDKLETITGVVSQAYGFYRILPLTNITVTESLTPEVSDPTTLVSDGTCSGFTFGGYNVENFYPGDTAHVQDVAEHIVTYMKSPDLVAVQEIQDNNGETDDGTVDSAETLTALADAIEGLGGAAYNFTYINPVNDQDGGAPGGNIRVAYLYNADVLQLKDANPGNSTAANEVLAGPKLKYNPGLIDPENEAWDASRKPLVAAWEILDGGATLFSVNVHWGSKGGSSSIHGDARPPVNGGVEDRQAQAEVTAAFIAEILAEDSNAYVVTAGDFNEFGVVKPVIDFASITGLEDITAVTGVEETERYSYLYDGNSQELDHIFISPALAKENTKFT